MLRANVDELGIGLNEKNKIEKSPPAAKSRNFKPRLDKSSGQLELSTFCIDELDNEQRWQLLDSVSDKPPILGRAEIRKDRFVRAGLTADPDWNPARHVNIVGWPKDEDDRLVVVQELYAAHAFVPRT